MDGLGMPCRPSSPPVKSYHLKTIVQISEPREIWSMPKYNWLSRTQNQPMSRPTNAATIGPAI